MSHYFFSISYIILLKHQLASSFFLLGPIGRRVQPPSCNCTMEWQVTLEVFVNLDDYRTAETESQ